MTDQSTLEQHVSQEKPTARKLSAARPAEWCAVRPRPISTDPHRPSEPTPWLTRKVAVAIVIGVFGYSYYVFTATLTVPAIRRQQDTWASPSEGIALFVVFNCLWLMFAWSYLRVLFTSAGFVKNYVEPSSPPPQGVPSATSSFTSDSSFRPGVAYTPQTRPSVSVPHEIRLEDNLPDTSMFDVYRPPGFLPGTANRASLVAIVSPRHTMESDRHQVQSPADESCETESGQAPARVSFRLEAPSESHLDTSRHLTPAERQNVSVSPSGTRDTNLTRVDGFDEAENRLSDSALTKPSPLYTNDTSRQPQSLPAIVQSSQSSPHSADVSRLSSGEIDPTIYTPPSKYQSPMLASKPEISDVLPESRSGAQRKFKFFSLISCVALGGPAPKIPTESVSNSLPPALTRIAPSVPLLDPSFRFCKKCQHVKPLRAHHCRHCGTCVLKMDHHCPWVGRCIGARNYKFFFNFLQWSSVYCIYLFLVLLIVNVRPRNTPPLDQQQLAIIIISGVFMIFTCSLQVTHLYLILYNMSTIEQMTIERMKRRERRMIDRTVGVGFMEKMRIVKRFDKEWGSYTREGNPWWIGYRKNWEIVMGTRKIGWILPIQARPAGDDGLDYQLNPRYTRDGVWRRRTEWPSPLQT